MQRPRDHTGLCTELAGCDVLAATPKGPTCNSPDGAKWDVVSGLSDSNRNTAALSAGFPEMLPVLGMGKGEREREKERA